MTADKTDIVERLREIFPLRADSFAEMDKQREEAATEIETLRRELEAAREALREIYDECQNTGSWSPIVMERMIERIELKAASALRSLSEGKERQK
jgi:hypothetical protein